MHTLPRCALSVSVVALSIVGPVLGQKPFEGAARKSAHRVDLYPVSRDFGPNRPPELTIEIAQTTFTWYSPIRFRVTVNDRDGDPLSVRLLHPPAGLVFDPLLNEQGPRQIPVRWDLPAIGRTALVFEATDGETTVREQIVLEVEDALLDSRLGDVTGDGIPDLVASSKSVDRPGTVPAVDDVGAIYVFPGVAGGMPSTAPVATLWAAQGVAQDYVRDFRLGDVNGDGILDIVAISRDVDIGFRNTGAAYVWLGGGSLTGDVVSAARLLLPGARQFDQLGFVDAGNGLHLVDLTGDGTLDIVTGGYLVDFDGTADVGGIFMWKGGAFAGDMAPTASLIVPGAQAGDELTRTSGQGIVFGDVTGDGRLDVLAGSTRAGTGGQAYVWAGAADMHGAVAPHATLSVSTASAGDQLGKIWVGTAPHHGNGLRMLDIDEDGVLDVMAVGSWADVGGNVDSGAIYLWQGGASLSGTLDPTVTLHEPTATLLGTCTSQNAILCGDVTGDGKLDLVVGAANSNVSRGELFVFEPDFGTPGMLAWTARLQVPGAVAFDSLLDTDRSQALQLVDLTGDGVLDILAAAQFADVGGVVDAGAVYTWAGGAGLTGGPLPPYGTLVDPAAGSYVELGSIGRQGYHAIDVTGDGLLDVVSGTEEAVHCWKSGPGFGTNPPVTLRSTTTGSPDELENGVHFADLDSDGEPDVVASAPSAVVDGVSNAGAVYVWSNVAALSGVNAPTAALTLASPVSNGRIAFYGIVVENVTGDGELDIVVDAPFVGNGAILVFEGGSISGDVNESATLTSTNTTAQPGAFWTTSRFVDLDGDATLDLLHGDNRITGAAQGSGGFFVFRGGFIGPTTETSTLINPSALPGDALGT